MDHRCGDRAGHGGDPISALFGIPRREKDPPMDREIGKGASCRNDGNAGGVLPERSDGHNPFGMDPRIGGLRRGDGHIPLEAKHPDQHSSGNSLLISKTNAESISSANSSSPVNTFT